MAQAKPIGKTLRDPRASTYLILFLSEGYDDDARFYNDCEAVFARLKALFAFSRPSRLGGFAFFTPSAALGTAISTPDNSAYQLFYDAIVENGVARPGIVSQRPRELITSIKALSAGNVAGEAIWLDPRLRPFRATVVLTDWTIPENGAGAPPTSYAPYAHAWSPGVFQAVPPADGPVDSELLSMLPVIIQTTWPIRPVETADPTPTAKARAATFVAAGLAHELGHAFGLEEEYEASDSHHGELLASVDATVFPNIATVPDPTLLNQGTASLPIEFLPHKWKGFVSAQRRSGAILVREHPPNVPSPAATAIEGEMATSVVALKHPSRQTGQDLPNDLTYGRVFRKKLPGANLLEGAGLYRRTVFRAFPDCTMRRPFAPWISTTTASSPTEIAAQVRQGSAVAFCPVCAQHLRGSVSIDDYLPDIRLVMAAECVNSRRAEAFRRHVQTNLGQINDDWACIAATQWRFETFLKTQIPKDLYAVNLPASPPEVRADWGNRASISYPARNGVHATELHDLWSSALLALRERVAAERQPIRGYPCLGAPGVLAASRLGALVNEMRDVPLGGVVIPTASTLTRDDLLSLQPGSIMQLWPNEETYVSCLEYVYGLIDETTCVNRAKATEYPHPDGFSLKTTPSGKRFPSIEGHSVVFLGVENDRLIIADQQSPHSDLESGWRGDFTFWIAAQWFDGNTR